MVVSTRGGTIEILEISSSRNNNSSVQSCHAEKMWPLSTHVFVEFNRVGGAPVRTKIVAQAIRKVLI